MDVIGAGHNDADLWMMLWNKVGECIDEGFDMNLVWTEAHTTLEEKAKVTLRIVRWLWPMRKLDTTEAKQDDPILVLLFLQGFDVANARVRAERNPLKPDVIHCVNDLGAAPPEWRIGDVQNMAKVSTVTVGSTTLGSH